MLSKRFFILLSYVWHGIFLTDFARLSYPKEIFLIFAVVVYLIIGFLVSKAVDSRTLTERFKRKPVVRGLIAGVLIGIACFFVATVVGISFSTGAKLPNMILDVTWQIIEQGVGGAVAGLVHLFVFDPRVFSEEDI
jgi:H+/Cl- antiporter ClcA